MSPLYEYLCECGLKFEKYTPFINNEACMCPRCFAKASKIPSVVHDHWGFTLTEASHHKGNDDELISRRPSNEGLIRA